MFTKSINGTFGALLFLGNLERLKYVFVVSTGFHFLRGSAPAEPKQVDENPLN